MNQTDFCRTARLLHPPNRPGEPSPVACRRIALDAPKNFDAGERIQTAIEPAAIRNGIDVAADEQRFSDSPRKVAQRFPAASL